MADISDVEDALVSFLTIVLYPAGSAQSSIIGSTCRIYRGWPNNATLNNDLSAGIVNVTVSADNDSGRTTTRYLKRTRTSMTSPGVQAVVQGGRITVAGSPNVGDVIGVLVDARSFSYRIQPGDTAALVAANLGIAIQVSRPVDVRGSVISIPGSNTVVARCVADGHSQSEVRRQEKDFRIISWCPTPVIRDSICAAIDAAFSQIAFLLLPDSTSGHVLYKNTSSYDQAQNALLYRRDLIFSIEYPTVDTLSDAAMLFGCSDLNGNITLG